MWDKEYYSEKAREKALTGVDAILELLPKPKEKPKAPPLPPCGYRQQLQQRTFKLDFEREVGRTKMVTLQTPRMQQGGYGASFARISVPLYPLFLASRGYRKLQLHLL